MAQQVDSKIVEMKFDNKQFESGVKTSLSTLDKLKSSLNLEGAAKGFKDIDEAANKVSLEGIASGIESLQKRFSILGTAGARIVENVTDSLMNLASNAASYVKEAIVTGGLKRAQNIENAHFQLQALLKDEQAVQAVMDNAMASVDGTAYAYDEAAKAAAQFAASGLKAGEDMEQALRGITGVAAMTNSQYSEISSIFTTVAGNGRLMGDQLLQLAGRGLNAAATVADYLREVEGMADITEKDVREMVSNAEVSFDMFVSAMDWAFGESAFRANETFSGALSNMKSALARIGAGFFSPLIEQNSDLVLLVNTLREKFNEVKSVLVFDEQKSAISGLAKETGLTTDALSQMFSSIKANGKVSSENLRTLSDNGVDAAQSLTDYINGVTDGSIRATYSTQTALKELTNGMEVSKEQVEQFVEDGKIGINEFTSAMETAYGDIETLSKTFTDYVLDSAKRISEYLKTVDLSTPITFLANIVMSVVNSFKALYSVLKPIGKAFSEVFKTFNGDGMMKFSENLKETTSNMKLSEENSKNLHDAFKGVFDVIGLLRDGFSGLLKIIFPFGDSVGSLNLNILGLAGSIGRALSGFTEWVRTSPEISNICEFLSNTVNTLSSFVAILIDKFKELIKGTSDFSLIQTGVELLSNAISFFGKAIRKVTPHFDSFTSIFDVIAGVIKSVGPIASMFFKTIGKGITFLSTSISNAVGGDLGLNGFVDLINSAMIYNLGKTLNKFIKSKDVVGKVTSLLTSVKNTLVTFQKELKTEMLKNIAVSIAILVGSLFVLATIDPEKMAAGLAAITVLMTDLFGALAAFDKVINNSKMSMTKISTGMIGLSTAVLILSSALKKISAIESDKLFGALEAITVLLAEMTAVSITLSKFGGKVNTGAVGIIAFSSAVYILSSAVGKLGELDVNTLIKGLSSIGVLLVELSAFMVGAKFGKIKATQATGILILSSALLVLQKAVEGFGELNTETLTKGIGSVGVVLAELAAFSMLTKDSKHTITTATSLVIIAEALKLLEDPMAEFGKMSMEEIGKGLLVIGGALGEVAITMKLLPKNTLSISIGLLAVAESLKMISSTLINVKDMSWEEIAKSLVELGGALGILAIAMNAMTGTLGASASMLIMSTALLALIPTLKTFGSMSWDEIAKGLVALGGAFAVIGLAAAVLTPIIPAIIGLGAAITLLGIGFASAGVGILAFSAGLTAVLAAGVASSAAVTEMLEIWLVGIANAITNSATTIGLSIKSLILVLCEIIIECAPTLVDTVLTLIKSLLTSLVDNVPDIASQFFDLVINIINALADKMPDIIQSVVNLIVQIFSGVISALNGFDISMLVDGIKAIGIIGAIVLELSLIGTMAVAAMAGVVQIGLVIAELAVVLAAIGALANIPGLDWLINKGGSLLESIGEAIGKFIGGIVGGVMEGVSNSLPAIGENLSIFANKAKGFFEVMEKIDSKVLDGTLILAEAIIALSAANFLNGLTKIAGNLLGMKDMQDMANDLEELGKGVDRFYQATKNIDPEVVTAAASCAKVLSSLYDDLPDMGGLYQKVFGQPMKLSDFALELNDFAPALVQFSETVDGKVSESAVQTSVNAAKILAAFYDELPDMGGLYQKIFGQPMTFKEFASEILSFGTSLALYSSIIDGKIDESLVTESVNAAKVLASLYDELPDMGGLAAIIFGDKKNLSDFGEELIPFATAISEYSTIISDVDSDIITQTANAAHALVSLENELGGEKGLISLFSRQEGLDDFGDKLKKFGEGLASYYESVKGVDVIRLAAVITEVENLIAIAKSLVGLDTSGLTTFASDLKMMGNNGITEFLTAFSEAQDRVDLVIQVFLGYVLLAVKNRLDSFKESGIGVADSWMSGISARSIEAERTGKTLANTVTDAIKTRLESFFSTGKKVATQFISGIKEKYDSAYSTGTSIANKVKSAITAMEYDFYSAGLSTARKIISGLEELITNQNDPKSFYKVGQNAAQGFIDGVLSKAAAAATAGSTLATTMSNAANQALDIHSPSRVMARIGEYAGLGFINGLMYYTSMASMAGEDLADAAMDGIQFVMHDLSDMFDEDGPVIRPMVDLTDVENSVSYINSLFNESIRMLTGDVSEAASLMSSKSIVSNNPEEPNKEGDSPKNQYTFIQNNTSPKALSRIEIYRQTKNQFAQFKKVVDQA